jgi:hypothetical protein
MKDSRRWQIGCGDLVVHAVERQPVLLAASPEHAPPQILDVISERHD